MQIHKQRTYSLEINRANDQSRNQHSQVWTAQAINKPENRQISWCGINSNTARNKLGFHCSIGCSNMPQRWDVVHLRIVLYSVIDCLYFTLLLRETSKCTLIHRKYSQNNRVSNSESRTSYPTLGQRLHYRQLLGAAYKERIMAEWKLYFHYYPYLVRCVNNYSRNFGNRRVQTR